MGFYRQHSEYLYQSHPEGSTPVSKGWMGGQSPVRFALRYMQMNRRLKWREPSLVLSDLYAGQTENDGHEYIEVDLGNTP